MRETDGLNSYRKSGTTKKYYWLKLKEDFFKDKEIKKLRKIAGGDTYTIIYLKLMLLGLRDEGRLFFEGIEDTFAEEIALELDEETENVKVTLLYLNKMGLLEEVTESEFMLTRLPECVGKETSKAELMRKKRAREKIGNENVPALPEPKTNAERQAAYKAKRFCQQKQHIPLVEDDINRKRYNGNYYIVFKRDMCKCRMCGSIETLCVHHIDGYDENKPENSDANKMITLCRTCHIHVHRSGEEIPTDILESIDYFSDGNESNGVTTLLPPVTECYTEIEEDIDIDTDKEEEAEEDIDLEKKEQREEIHYQQIADMYNEICISYPRIRSLSEARKKAIKARIKSGYTINDFKEIFERAEQSTFLKGGNDRNWSATFDWMMKDANAVKILEGNYADKAPNKINLTGYSNGLVEVNGKQYIFKNGKYYIPHGNGIAVNPNADDDLPF